MTKIPPNDIDSEFLKRIINDKKLMVALTRRSMFYFFYIYFGSYIKYPIAPFHYRMFQLAEDERIKRFGIVAFRGSAKSTVLNTAYSLWAIMGVLKKKHIVIASHTQQRVRDHSDNIAREIEQNMLLRRYLGPFLEKQERWSVPVRIIPRYGARITFVSVEEGIRGLRDGPHRPDLIIVDDIEDSNSVRTKEGRDKVFNWLTGELLPTGDRNTKVVFIGNFLHEDSAFMRVKKMMDEGLMDGEFMRVPILDEEERITWPGMFPSREAVEEFKRGIGSEYSWQLEYMLKYVPGEGQIIRPEDIHYYPVKPQENYWVNGKFVNIMKGPKGTGVDLAISLRESADFTAMVSGDVIFLDEVPKLYIESNPFKGRIGFHETIERAKAIQRTSGGFHQFFVENVAYQQAAIQDMKLNSLPVIPMQALQDKTARLHVAATYIKNGTVLFPEKGCEELIHQLIYFGSESHDDIADALAYLILGMVNAGGMYFPKVVALL